MGIQKQIIIVGASGFAKEVAWLAEECGYKVKGFLDDNQAYEGQEVFGKPVLGVVDDWTKNKDCEFNVAIGSPKIRNLIVERMLDSGSPKFATLIHPEVVCSKYVEIGEGTVICAGSILTTDIKIGEHTIINLNCTIGHDVIMKDFVTIAPMVAISGNVTLDDFAEIGTGACIRQGLTVGRGAMLGMGGVLTKNIEPSSLFFGAPARKIKKLEPI